MASLTQHTMINKWDDDINEAITSVGGDTYGSSGLPDYPEIIKTQLVSNEAVGKGIYQDFLYVDDKNQTSPYPWEGEPTNSTNAVQAGVLADSIKQLFDIMASTERFKVYLVDELPKEEIDLSAVYLIRSKCECGDELENHYEGCYYIKTGKTSVKKIDIPEFSLDLSKLFFLTRAEYDAGLSDYVAKIEELLKQKFGKYWDDEGFALDTMLDQMVEDIKAELKTESDKILENVKIQIDEAVGEAVAKLEGDFAETVEQLEEDFNSLKNQVEGDISTKLKEVDSAIASIGSAIDDVNLKIDSAIDDVNDKVDVAIGEVNTKLEEVDSAIASIGSAIDEMDKNIQSQFDELTTEVNSKIDKNATDIIALGSVVESNKIELQNSLNELTEEFDEHKTEYTDLKNIVSDLAIEVEARVKKSDLVAVTLDELNNDLK